jgi:hypothetical protein
MRCTRELTRTFRILVGVFVAVVSLWLTASEARAQARDQDYGPVEKQPPATLTVTEAAPVPAPKAKSNQSTYKPYFVEFRARNAATYGHMYVIYGQVNSRGEIVKSDIAGLHPAGDANDCDNCSIFAWTIGHFIPVPAEIGASDGDLEEKYVLARYRVMVDAATYNRVVAHVAKLKADRPMWNALVRSCVTFGNGIAEVVGLKTPGFTLVEPKTYVESLRKLNNGPAQQGRLRFAAPSAPKATVATPTNTAASTAAPAPVPKPKKQPIANPPVQQTAGAISGATH